MIWENLVMGCVATFLIGVSMRFGTRKRKRPWLTTVCLLVIIIAWVMVEGLFRDGPGEFKIRVIIMASMALGTCTAELAYRIYRRRRRK